MPDERPQDLSADEAALEERVAAMMEPEAPAPEQPSAKITVKVASEAEEVAEPVPTAPIPAKAKPAKKTIAIQHDEDSAKPAKSTPKPIIIAEAAEPPTNPGQVVPETEPASAPEVPKELLAAAQAPSEPETAPAAKPAEPEASEEQPTDTTESAESPEPTEAAGPVSADELPVQETEEPFSDKFNDLDTAKVIEDIVATEADELIAAPEAPEVPVAPRTVTPRPERRFSVKALFANWWHNPLTRWGTILVGLGLLAGVGVWPSSRYLALNTVGIRASASVQVMDQSTLQPLKGVKVQLGNKTATTDQDGRARMTDLKLGPTLLVIEKRAFAAVTERTVIGWGSNPLGSRSVNPVGSQYSFVVTDFLSGKPVGSASASAKDADANADDKGAIKLTMEHTDEPEIKVTVTAPGYRSETLTLDSTSKQETALVLVPARKHVFVSKRSGTYDVFKVDVDGKNEQLLLNGTGREREDMALAPHPKSDVVALVSTRDDKRNADGFLLSTLTLLQVSDGSNRTIVQSEQVNVIGWIDDRLIFVQIAAGASAANPSRQRLMSYDYKTRDLKQLASTNYFNDVLVAQDKVYFAPSATNQATNVTGLYRIGADGNQKETIVAQETWNMIRATYDKIVISVPNQWFEFTLDATSAVKLDGQPGSTTSRSYVDSLDGTRAAWVDTRDGKGVLLTYDRATKKDISLVTQSGIRQPVYWLSDNALVYRVQTDAESADYAVSTDGGKPIKIRDVTNTGNIDKWYYY